MTDQLATSQDLADALQVSLGSLNAASATLVLQLATAKVQRAAGGQRIVDLTDTATIDVDWWEDGQYLALPQSPVRSVATVVLDGVTITDWLLRKQKLWRVLGWMTTASQPSQVLVTYTHGYVAGSQWLQLARNEVLSLAKAGYGNPSGYASESIDDHSVSYAEADARMQLSPWSEQAIAAAYGSATFVTVSEQE